MPDLAPPRVAMTRGGVIPSCGRMLIPSNRGPARPLARAALTSVRAGISAPGGPNAIRLQAPPAPPVAVLRTSVARSLRRAAVNRTLLDTRPASERVAVSVIATSPAAEEAATVHTPKIAIVVRLASALTLLGVHAAHPALGARRPRRGGLMPSRTQTLGAAVPIGRRPRASDFRRCYPALVWLPAGKPKIGFAPAALLSTVNLLYSASASLRRTNSASTAA